MDVRCEKCQTEYELDESRLKPGGVTVKCTNCGHMFKIRKRASTNVGVPTTPATPTPVVATPPAPEPSRPKPPSKATPPMPQQAMPRAASNSDAPMGITDAPSGPSSQRQWLVRLENGETRTCSELATLQQWIVAGAVSRESLISRSGKTWKRLGDIAELSQYFTIADEAKAQRSARPTGPAGKGPAAATMLGVGGRPSTHDDEEGRSTGNFRARPPTPAPPKAAPIAIAQTELAPSGPMSVPKRPPTQPPPPPPAAKKIDVPPGRATAAWANNEVKASESMAAMPQGPRGGKLSAAPDEGFAGKVRVQPSDRSTFDGKVATMDDDDDVYTSSRGSRAGMWIALVALLVIGAAAGAVYMFVFKVGKKEPVAQATQDAGTLAAPADAGQNVVVAPIIDAQVEIASPLDTARGELVAGVHARMKSALESLNGKDDPASLALRARLMTGLAQGMQDRAGFVDKAEADKLRKEAKQIVIDAAPLAQRALAGQADSVDANLAMADVLRLQGKPAPSVKRYITTAKGKADKAAAPSVALSEALLSLRDGKLPDAANALAAVVPWAPDDMRIKTALALVAYAQNKQADAKAQVDQILATQPDHDAALAMYKKLETVVAKDDPLPPEDGGNKSGGTTKPPTNPPDKPNTGGGGGDYDSLLAQANKAAETNCTKAMDLYSRALSQKPQGVEALTGMGYCHLDRKEFSSAFSKFRAALLVSPRFEPALGGIAETYQRQGNKTAAIDAWNKYLVVFPGSPKAKKQLEILGAGDAPKPPPTTPQPPPDEKKPEGGTDTPPPPPSPTPTPAGETGSASN
jgi:predicted Zn finger-like uncharacterized protein